MHPSTIRLSNRFVSLFVRLLVRSFARSFVRSFVHLFFFFFLPPKRLIEVDFFFISSYQHCSKGKTMYAPQIVFLHCGGSSALPKGVWYHMSYGTIAFYKQDWESFGGFSKGFEKKETWGGEDWDIIDGAVKSGLETERKSSPSVYHFYHTKNGMW